MIHEYKLCNEYLNGKMYLNSKRQQFYVLSMFTVHPTDVEEE